jgi:anti-anti-sigma factor
MPFVYPDNDLTYCGNFLNMLFRTTELKYRPNPTLERALDVLFILHADHEQNCSSTAMRVVGSSHVDPYSATAAATAALYGPLHGGANEAVLRMLLEIGSINNIPAYIKSVKAGEKLLMGFGHRVYKNYDPRARIVKHIAYEVFDVMGKNPLIEIALECERIALEDEYFVKRKLYPNVDFYTGLIYQSMGFPVTMFPVLFAIPRTSGWIAQWEEMLLDPEQKISRGGSTLMDISTRESGAATIVDVVGDITLYNSPQVRKVLLDLLRTKKAPRVIVNLEKVRYIDSAGVASLVEGLKVSRDLKSTFALFGLSRTAREVLELTRLIKVFEVYNTEEEALRGGSTNVAPAR